MRDALVVAGAHEVQVLLEQPVCEDSPIGTHIIAGVKLWYPNIEESIVLHSLSGYVSVPFVVEP